MLRGVEVVEVTEDELADGIRALAHEHGIVAEGAGAAAVAAIRAGKAPEGIAVVSGRNITLPAQAQALTARLA
jgi:threonine dehydratase